MRFLILTLSFALSSCMYAQKTEAEFHAMLDGMYKQTVPLVQEVELKASPENYVILDTREPAEFAVSHLPQAKLAGYDDFDPVIVEGLPKDQKILVYCSVGYRSERIGERLQEMGFTEVYNLYGGIFEWKNHGNEVLDEVEQETEKVHTYNRKWSQWLRVGEKVF